MASFVERIQRFFQRLKGSAGALAQQPYEIPCNCGSTIKGQRRETWIEAECDSCFETVFVLPANVYPSTKRVPSQVLGNFKERLSAAITELFPPREKSPEKAAKKKAAPAPDDQVVDDEPLSGYRIKRPGFHPTRWAKSLFSPVRLILLAMCCVIFGTGYWLVQQRELEDAQQVWRTSPETIEQLLTEQEFSELSDALQKAVVAGQLLEKNDEEWRRFRNLQREVDGCRQVSAGHLLDAIDQAYTAEGKLKSGAAVSAQEGLGAGYFVFDAQLAANDAENTRFGFGFPGLADRHGIEFEIAMPELTAAIDQMNGELLFVVRIKDVKAPDSEFDRWLCKLSPKSFALLTEPTMASFLGLPVEDESLGGRLNLQREFVESSAAFANSMAKTEAETGESQP